MSRQMSGLMCFVLVLGLSSTAWAWTDIDEFNYNLSFEYDSNGEQLYCSTRVSCGEEWDPNRADCGVMAWLENDVDWPIVEIQCHDPMLGIGDCKCKDGDFDVTDGHIDLTLGQWGEDANLIVWQTLDPAYDGNVIIRPDYEYKVTFDSFRWQGNELRFNFYYGYISESNSVELDVNTIADFEVVVGTEPWDTVTYSFEAEGGEPYIDEPLGLRFYQRGQGWHWIDDVRLEFRALTKAREPEPADGAVDLPRTGITLRWVPGTCVADDVNSHEVYFGTDRTAVEDANTNTAGIYRGNASGGPDVNGMYYYMLPDTLPLGQRCYWRVDEVNEGYVGPSPPLNGRWIGDIWSFRITGTAINPDPANGATDVPVYTDLNWTAGTGSQKHDIYFGTDQTAVTDADTSSSVYLGRQTATTVDNSNLVPAPLLNTKYYWRIDEVNETSGVIIDGDIWNFTTAEYTLVEDFDGYANTEQLLKVWKDYWANGTCAEVGVITVEELVEDGNSIAYSYDNGDDPHYSEAYADVTSLGIDSNWTLGAVEALRLAFKGSSGNAIEDMYVAITDGSGRTGDVLYDGDPNDIAKGWMGFQEWNIDLDAFVDDNSVDLTDVQRLTIGFGDKTEGGMGVVYFDNIRLYPSRCVPALVHPLGSFRYINHYTQTGSFTPDCVVDYYDVASLAGDWLMSGIGSVTASAPSDVNLVGYWKLDDNNSTGTGRRSVRDWSGNGYHCVLFDPDGDPGETTNEHSVPGVPDLPGELAISFDGADDYIECPVLNLNSNAVTFCAWIKRDGDLGDLGGYPAIVECNDPNGFAFTFSSTATYAAEEWRANNELCYYWTGWSWDFHTGLIVPDDEWVFVALVIEPTVGTIYMYDGGQLYASRNYEEHVPKTFAGNMIIGAQDGEYRGAIDDVRIYDYSLTPEQIVSLSLLGGAGSKYVSLESWRADADGDDTVDLKDYTIVADNWFEELLWPGPQF
jgi:hypothetical protein